MSSGTPAGVVLAALLWLPACLPVEETAEGHRTDTRPAVAGTGAQFRDTETWPNVQARFPRVDAGSVMRDPRARQESWLHSRNVRFAVHDTEARLHRADSGPVVPAKGAESLRTDTRRVVQGTDAPDDPAAVALIGRRTRCGDSESPALLCSGALIAPDVVLTAAHCLAVFGQEGPHEVFFGQVLLPRPEAGGRFVRVARAVIHPDYDARTHAYDAALLRLAVPVDVAPFPLSDSAPVAGSTVRVVGYGYTKDATEPSGQRRQGTLSVTEVEPAAFRAGPAPGMSCVGDSGGPVLLRDGDREVLAGLTVSGDTACRLQASNVRVDALLDGFIRPFLAEVPLPGVPTLPPADLCSASCTRDAECPSGLTCVSVGGAPGRCLLPALQEGSYGAACADDAACGAGSLCARLEPEGEDACRCFTPCTPPGEPSVHPVPEPEEGGCASAPGPLLLGLLAWVGAWKRRRGC